MLLAIHGTALSEKTTSSDKGELFLMRAICSAVELHECPPLLQLAEAQMPTGQPWD